MQKSNPCCDSNTLQLALPFEADRLKCQGQDGGSGIFRLKDDVESEGACLVRVDWASHAVELVGGEFQVA